MTYTLDSHQALFCPLLLAACIAGISEAEPAKQRHEDTACSRLCAWFITDHCAVHDYARAIRESTAHAQAATKKFLEDG